MRNAPGTRQRKIKIAAGQRGAGTDDQQFVDVGMRGQQPGECRRSGQHDARAPLLQQPGISDEMERIADALFGEQ